MPTANKLMTEVGSGIDRALMEYVQVQSLAIEYTGPIPDDYAVML